MNIKIALPLIFVMLISGCADTVTFDQASNIDPIGFWYGLWHGFTLGFSWVGSLIWDDISIYAIYNSGGWYDFGFFLGAGALGGAGTSMFRS